MRKILGFLVICSFMLFGFVVAYADEVRGGR